MHVNSQFSSSNIMTLSLLFVLLSIGVVCAQSEFDVIFQHRTWNPNGLFSSYGRLTLGLGGKATMRWKDVSRQSVTLGAARNATHALGVDFSLGPASSSPAKATISPTPTLLARSTFLSACSFPNRLPT
jgi:hypothetical protein